MPTQGPTVRPCLCVCGGGRADMLGWLDLIMGPTARTKSSGSSHGGPTGRGVVRHAHWRSAAPF